MKKLILSAATAAFMGLLASAGPVAALPGPAAIATPETGIVTAQMTQRQRMMNRRAMRNRAMRRGRVMRGGDPNAKNPSRRPRAQQRGMTSGGPRY